jgi:hypothetical protein
MLLSVNGKKTLEKTEGAIKMDNPEKLAKLTIISYFNSMNIKKTMA